MRLTFTGVEIAWALGIVEAVNLLFAIAALVDSYNLTFVLIFQRSYNIVFLTPELDATILFATYLTILIILMWAGATTRVLAAQAVLGGVSGYAYLLTGAGAMLGSVGLIVYAVVSLYEAKHVLRKMNIRFQEYVVVSLLAIFGLVEVTALTHWIFYPYNTSLSLHAADLELQIYYLPYWFVPEIFIALLFCWLIFPFIRGRNGRITESDHKVGLHEAGPYVILTLAVILGIYLTLFPYMNAPLRLVGVDDNCCYMPSLLNVIKDGPLAGPSDRLLLWVFLWLLQHATSLSPSQVLFSLPPLFTVGLSIASFILAKAGTGDDLAAAWSALFAALFFNTTAVIIIALFAQWLAVIFALAYFAALLTALRFGRHWPEFGAIGIALSLAVLLLHPYTWEIFMAVTVLFTILRIILDEHRLNAAKRGIPYLAVLLGVNCVAVLQRVASHTVLSGGVGMGVTLTSLSTTGLQPLSFATLIPKLLDPVNTIAIFWYNLGYFMKVAGIHYADWLIPLLGLIGIAYLYRFAPKQQFTLLMVAWLVIASCLTVILGNFASPYTNQYMYMPLIWRAFLITPFQIPAGVGMASVKRLRGYSLFSFVVILVMLNHALRALAMLTVF